MNANSGSVKTRALVKTNFGRFCPRFFHCVQLVTVQELISSSLHLYVCKTRWPKFDVICEVKLNEKKESFEVLEYIKRQRKETERSFIMAKHHPDLIFCRKQPGVGERYLQLYMHVGSSSSFRRHIVIIRPTTTSVAIVQVFLKDQAQ